MWLVIPPMWVWLLSQLGGSGATYALVLLGLPVSLMLWGRVLVRLDALHARAASHMSGDVEERPSWLTPCLTGSLIVALVVLLAAALLGLLPSSSGHAFGPFPD
jgi:hypothetical protein